MATRTPITVAHGDGIGPEIMAATLHILEDAGAQLDIETIEVGEKVYLSGNTSGIRAERLGFPAPHQGVSQGAHHHASGRRVQEPKRHHAQDARPVRQHPSVRFLPSLRTHQASGDGSGRSSAKTKKICTLASSIRPPPTRCRRSRSSRGRARRRSCATHSNTRCQYKRKKVTCFTKDNILKMTDGLFHKIFDEISPEYPDIEKEHWIVDIGAAKMADTPEAFDVIVMPNLYGDVLSDVAAQIAGSVGLAGSSNIGDQAAMFEAIHGSAPRRAGQNLANPSGLLHGALLMLVHIGQTEVGERIHNAWLRTMEDGIHTYDIFTEGKSKQKVGTKEFARGGDRAARPKAANAEGGGIFHRSSPQESCLGNASAPKKDLVGVDVYIEWPSKKARELATAIGKAAGDGLKLEMIANRGVKVWPDGSPETFCTDEFPLPLPGCFPHAQADRRAARSRGRPRSRNRHD